MSIAAPEPTEHALNTTAPSTAYHRPEDLNHLSPGPVEIGHTFLSASSYEGRLNVSPSRDDLTTSTMSSSSPSSQGIWSVALFSVSTILLFADQNLMAPNLTAIARDFGFDNDERDRKLGGDIAFAFFVLGAPASYVIGCLGDTYNRSILFAITVGIGESACLATAFCQTYLQLYWSRATTGFALGGALPLIYSVLGDLFQARQRHMVGGIVGMGTGLGILLGQAVAGFIGPTHGWRLPFVIISLPALVCAVLVLLTVKDPPRGQMEAAAIAFRRQDPMHQSSDTEDCPFVNEGEDNVDEGVEMAPTATSKQRRDRNDDVPGHLYHHHTGDDDEEDGIMSPTLEGTHDYWETFKMLLRTPTVLLCLIQGAPGCVPWGIINTYLNDYLSENKGMTIEAATTVAMAFGLGNFFGLLLGGAGGSYLYTRDNRWPALLSGITAVAGCFPFWLLINLDNAPDALPAVYCGAIAMGFFSGVTGPVIRATLQNVTLPQARGQAFALFNTFDDFGRGLGPVFVSALISFLGGRQPAFNVGVFGWVICGIVNLLVFFTVDKDEQQVQVLVSAQLSSRSRSND
ncbi:hypothetical protein ACA910_013485 [Epithemia clementina (nom. ined.)]